MIKQIKSNWWILLIIVIVLFLITVGIIDNKLLNKTTKNILEYINLIVTPLGVILGLILGYPLLRKKLVEGYVLKQFNIIDDANRQVRKRCLELLEEYPVADVSNSLTKEYVDIIITDLKELKDITIDANRDVYKYTKLVYDSVVKFQNRTRLDIPSGWKVNYYCETLSTFVHIHIQSIYDLSSSIAYVPSNEVKKKGLLNKKLKKYVRDNDTYTV